MLMGRQVLERAETPASAGDPGESRAQGDCFDTVCWGTGRDAEQYVGAGDHWYVLPP